jgi:hypothetical protein
MFQRPPREAPWLSWCLAIGWTLIIYLTIPLARTIQEFVSENLGRPVFTYLVVAVVVLAIGVPAAKRWRSAGLRSWPQVGWLLLIGGVFVVWAFRLGRGAPEEGLHFVQYGVLAVLLFRAYSHAIQDVTIYISAFLLGSVLGTMDEVIQWVVPTRHFDFKDIALNGASCFLALLAISRGLTPAYVVRRVSRDSVVRLFFLGTLLWLLILACLLNTPRARAGYLSAFPWLPSAVGAAGYTAQYGFLIDDPDIGRFKSRFNSADLAAEDRRRGAEAGAILDSNHPHNRDRYLAFLKTYSVVSDPFIHEARVHLYRRDHYRHASPKFKENDPDKYRYHVMVACRENRIVERYFPYTLSHSLFRLSAEGTAWLERDQDAQYDYFSPVSKRLFTLFTPREMLAGMGGLWLAWAGGCIYAVRRMRRGEAAAADSIMDE